MQVARCRRPALTKSKRKNLSMLRIRAASAELSKVGTQSETALAGADGLKDIDTVKQPAPFCLEITPPNNWREL